MLLRSPLRLRYTLRALLVFITLFCLWGGYHANRGFVDRRAEKVLRTRTLAFFQYASGSPGIGPLPMTLRAYSRLVEALWGDRPITGLSVEATFDPETIDAINSLRSLRALDICYATAPTASAHITGPIQPPRNSLATPALTRMLEGHTLHELRIRNLALDASGWEAVIAHDSLHDLHLVDLDLDASSFANLLRMTHIQSVYVQRGSITGEVPTDLIEYPTLEVLVFRGTSISNRLGSVAAQCPKLIRVEANHPSVDDSFVRYLGAHPALKELYLDASSVSDESIGVVQRMPSLQTVALPRKSVSLASINALKKVRRSTTVFY